MNTLRLFWRLLRDLPTGVLALAELWVDRRVREIHRATQTSHPGITWCVCCDRPWPCEPYLRADRYEP